MIKSIKTIVLLSSLLLVSCGSSNEIKEDYEVITIIPMDLDLYRSNYDDSITDLNNISLRFVVRDIDFRNFNNTFSYFDHFAHVFDFPKNVIELINQPVYMGGVYEITYDKKGNPISFTGPKERNRLNYLKLKVKQKSDERIEYDPDKQHTGEELWPYVKQELRKKIPV